MRLSPILRSLIVFLLLTGAGTASAQVDFIGPRSQGMGEAHRAIVSGNDAVFLNPAGMSLSRKYSVEAGYLWHQSKGGHIGSVSVIDSLTSRVAAGISFGYVTGNRDVWLNDPLTGPYQQNLERKGQTVRLALSMPFSPQLALGISGNYVDISYGDRQAVNAVTIDAGLIYQLSKSFSVSVVGYGLTNTGSAEAPLAMALGLAVGPPNKFQFAFDWVIDFTTRKYLEELPNPREGGTAHRFNAGFELLLARAFAIRAGYFHDRITRLEPDNGIAFGLGYFAAKAKLGASLAFEQRFNNNDDRRLIFAIQLFL